MTTIDLLVPALSRPRNARPLVESIHANTEVPHRVIFLCSPGDYPQIEAAQATGSLVVLVEGENCQYARKINEGCRVSEADFLFLGADDLRFHPDWDRAAIETFHAHGKPVVGTNDLGNATVMRGEHATHSLVHRSYLERGTIDEPWKLLHEGYNHNWVDTEFIATAKKRDAFVFCAESKVEHMHPFWKKGKTDDVYAKGMKYYRRDHALYQARRGLWR